MWTIVSFKIYRFKVWKSAFLSSGDGTKTFIELWSAFERTHLWYDFFIFVPGNVHAAHHQRSVGEWMDVAWKMFLLFKGWRRYPQASKPCTTFITTHPPPFSSSCVFQKHTYIRSFLLAFYVSALHTSMTCVCMLKYVSM